MKEGTCNWRGIGSLVVVMVCLVSVMSPAMTQSSLSMFGNISNGTNGENGNESIPTPTPTPTPTLTPSPTPTPTPSLTPTPDPTSSPSPAPTPTPTHSPTPTSGPTPTLTPTPSPSPAPSPTPTPTPSPAAPDITSFAPDSLVHDTEGETRTFNITTNQVVNVSWLLNGTEVQKNESVTEASYTNISAIVGTWNVSALAYNENGTGMQTWVWNVSQQVTPTPSPIPTPAPTSGPTPSPSPITKSSPAPAPTQILSSNGKPSMPFYIYGWVYYENDDPCNNSIVNINNTNTSKQWQADTNASYNFYQLVLDTTNISKGNVLEFNVTDGIGHNTAKRTIVQSDINNGTIFNFNLTLPVPPLTINVELIPDDDPVTPEVQVINTNLTTPKTVTIIAIVTDLEDYRNITNSSVLANITGPSNVTDSPVSLMFISNSSLKSAIYNGTFNMSYHAEGEYKVEVNATNVKNFAGVGSKNFNYSYGPDLIVTNISTPFYLIPNKSNTINAIIRNNGTTARAAEFNVSLSLIANETIDTVTVSSLNASDNASVDFNWTPSMEGNYTLTVMADSNHAVSESNETNNNFTTGVFVGVPDFNVTNITFDSPEPVIGDVVKINATIANFGVKNDTTFVEFYDNKNIEIKRTKNDYLGEEQINDTLTLPNALKIRVHFSHIGAYFKLAIYDKNNQSVELEGDWTGWASGDTIRIQSWYADFIVDRYEALLANKSISLDAKNFTNVTANWNLSLQEMGWATHGEHNITVIVDPSNQIVEYDEENNVNETEIPVNASLDFAVTNISLDPTEPLLNDTVKINATIANPGKRDGTTIVEAYYDNRSIIEREISPEVYSTDTISLPADVHRIRVHFNYTRVGNYEYIVIYNENEEEVEKIYEDKRDFWTDYIYSDAIKIESKGADFRIDRYEAPIKNETVTLNASQNKTFNLDWIANTTYGGAGHHNISVKIDPHDSIVETNETNNTRFEQIFVNGTDLAITNMEISCGESYENFCYRRQDVHINVTIANLGALDASNFSVNFKDGLGEWNTSGVNTTFTPPTTFNLSLKSGEDRSINVTWNPAEFGNHTITACIPFDNTDNNKTNNELPKLAIVQSEWDFSVENVSVEPEEVREGANVSIVATIGNSGFKPGNVSVGFYVNSTDFVGSGDERFIRIGTIDDVPVGVNETNNGSFTWNANIAGGDHLIVAVADPDENVTEIEDINKEGASFVLRGNDTATGNNVKNCTLHVIPPQVNITNLMLDPTQPEVGDKVNVIAEIKNDESMQANSTVWFYMERNVSVSGIPDKTTSDPPPWNWAVSQPEHFPMRVHFHHIEIKKQPEDIPPGNTTEEVIADDVITAYVDDQPVFFYVKSEDVAESQAVKIPQIDFNTPCAECKVRNLNAVCIDKRWEDVWTEWSCGNKLEVKVDAKAPVSLDLLIDKYQVRLGNRTVTLNATSEPKLYNVTWNASLPLALGNYTLIANVEDKVVRNKTCLSGTDLAVTNVSVKEEVMDGDRVNITATIHNFGAMNATNFTIKFWDIRGDVDEEILINKTSNISLMAGNSMSITVPWNASRSKIWHRICDPAKCWWEPKDLDTHQIKVEIDLLDNIEKDKTNNLKEAKVHVNRSRDFEVTNLNFTVKGEHRNSSELVLYDLVTLNATLNITNLANQGGSVNVSFYLDDEHEIRNASVPFDVGNGTEYAVTNWSATIGGDHEIIVKVDPEVREDETAQFDGRTIEFNESNNDYTQQIHVKAPDLTVTNLTFDSDSLKKGDSVNITVEIANCGKEDASNVTLSIYDCAGRHIEDVEGYSGLEQMEIKRKSATALRLYLDLKIGEGGGGEVCIYDSKGEQITYYNESYHGWTPWVLGNNITVVANGDAYPKVSKVYYLEQPSEPFNTTTHDFKINEPANITVNWTASPGGERFIAAIIDPDDIIPEYNELNNTKAEYITVKTVDLIVSNLTHNGTEIKHGDVINISANITNNGTEEVENFTVRFLADDLIKNETKSLAPKESISVFAIWNATVGDKVLKVEADYEDVIDETNETNNIDATEIYVCGPELGGNISWRTLGLHDDILSDDTTQPYDEDEVNITANIMNSGCLNTSNLTANFGAAMLFDYTPYTYHKPGNREPKRKWINESYDHAICIYLDIDIRKYQTIAIYDGNGKEVKKVDKSCWVHVPGDIVNITYCDKRRSAASNYTISFYPVYEENITRIDSLGIKSSTNISLGRNVNVSTGDYMVIVFIDPENKVPEDNKQNNIVAETIDVNATRDFTVTNVTVTAEKKNLSDFDITNITARVANIGLRNGTTEVDFVDYENETRIYKYYFDKNLSLSYLPISPDATLSSVLGLASQYSNLTIIHRLGVDAVQLHFNEIAVRAPGPCTGKLWICDDVCKYEEGLWKKMYKFKEENIINDVNILVPGDTVYIYTTYAYFNLSGYTTKKEFYCEENVSLNATIETKESKNITAPQWNASTGVHNITVTIDPDNKIGEINESNNTFNLLLSVNASKDPEIVELNYSVQNPEPGQDPWHPGHRDNVRVNATVCNNGYKTANFTVDLWAETRRKFSGSMPEPDANWSSVQGDKIRYVRLLNHTNVSLAPGNFTNVTAVWENMSVADDPTHIVMAIIDPLGEIDEMNESNNEISQEIIMDYPDFTVAGFNAPTERNNNASVNIENKGGSDASNVTVMLELTREKEHKVEKCCFGSINLSHSGAANIRVHFKQIDAEDGEVEIKKSPEIYEPTIESYSGEFGDVWTPRVTGDTVYICYSNAGFWIDKYEWGDVEYNTIDNLNASESVNVSLPARWSEYEGVEVLNVTVDPYDEIVEQKEDNNNRNATIYVDLMLEEIGTVFSEDGKLSGINATIVNNDKAVPEEGRGIAFPAYDFDVELSYSSDESIQTKRIGENETIYGGEEREVLFTVNDSTFTANKTYLLNVLADSKTPDEIEEFNEKNNNDSIPVGPDISVGEIYITTPDDSCICYVGALIKNEGNLKATNFFVRLYLNCTTENWNETSYEEVDLLSPNEEINLTFWDIQVEVKPNEIYDVKIIADPENTVEESNEWNNETEETIGPDLIIDGIKFYSDEGAERESDKLLVGENQTIRVLVNNTGKVGAKDFYVKIWINSSNNTIISPSFYVDYCVPHGEVKPVDFKWTPTPQERGWYILNATIDLYNDTHEWNNKGDAEMNNNKNIWNVKVGERGYEAKEGFMQMWKMGEDKFNGGIIYTYDKAGGYLVFGNKSDSCNATFGNPIPENAHKKEVRLYVYPDWAYWPLSTEPPWKVHRNAFLPDPSQLEVTFNGGPALPIIKPASFTPEVNALYQPTDIPDATGYNASYATYCYDVTGFYDDTTGANNWAKAEKKNCGDIYAYEIRGMALLIVYEDPDAPLIRYWVGEDRDVMYAKFDSFESTGFEYDKCTRKVKFGGVTDARLANATLKTVLVSYNAAKDLYTEAEGIADAVHFNPDELNDPDPSKSLQIPLGKDNGHWHKVSADIALTNRNEGWEYVDVVKDPNYAAIQSRGAFMGVAHAILKVTYPPDLEPSVKKDLYATAGNPYDIEVDINNLGKSKAKDFNVTVSIDGVEVFNDTIGEIKGVGQDSSSIPLRFTKKAPPVETIVKHNVTVVVDPEDKVKELINNYPRGELHKKNGEDNNNITREVTVVVESGELIPPLHPGGRGGGTGGGWGTGTGTGEGSGEGEGTGTGGAGGEGAVGERGGKAIRGYLMKGSVVSSEEGGGGGKGEFSLVGLLLRLAMLAAAVSLVCAGYLLEKRRHNSKQ